MTGIEMLMKNAISAVFKSLNISGEEIIAKFEMLKTAIPAFAERAENKLQSVDTRLAAIETQLATVLAATKALDALLKVVIDFEQSDPHVLPAGQGQATVITTDLQHATNDLARTEDGKWLATNGIAGVEEWIANGR